MKTTLKFNVSICLAMSLLLVCSCGSHRQQSETATQDIMLADVAKESSPASPALMSSSAAIDNPADTIHKFIRTANVDFDVQNVETATYAIEDIAAKFGGFVTKSQLRNDDYDTKIIPVNADSAVRVITSRARNTMVLRVPANKLDSTLRAFAPLITFLNSRNIDSRDVALQLLSVQASQRRARESGQRITKAIDASGKRLSDITDAENMLDYKKEQEDIAKIERLSITDSIKYSAVEVNISQQPTVTKIVVPNIEKYASYRSPFGYKVVDALKFSWMMLEGFVLLLIRIWWVIILVGGGIYFWRKRKE